MRLRSGTVALLTGMACASSPPAPATSAPRASAPPATARSATSAPTAAATPIAPAATNGTSAPADEARLYALHDKVWIWPRPNADGRFLGYVRAGQSVALRAAALVRGENCRGGFYAVEP